ncbi:MAG: polysaccharide deacetylase family protein [Candidatus Falkowbacteria bacterium]
MRWINFLHLYQPANTDAYHVKEATEKSYLRLVRALEEHPEIKFTLNITGCLFLRFEELGYTDLIERLKKLLDKGQIEITGTAAYHGLLPLLPEEEIIAQIKENEDILRKYFGADFKPRGFFMPEMAYGVTAAKIIKQLGYEWIVLDEIAFNGKLNQVDFSKVYLDENSGLKIVFRSRAFSNSYIPDKLIDFFDGENLIITGTDAELYGLRHEDPTAELEKVLKVKSFSTELFSEFVAKAELVKAKPVACSWESNESDLRKNEPYILWWNKKNKIQIALWDFANFTQKVIADNKADDNYVWARWHLVRGLASCTFWWASGHDFTHNFGPNAWSPDDIERGLSEFIRAIRSLHDVTTRSTKIKAEKVYIKIKAMIWQQHWKNHWKK